MVAFNSTAITEWPAGAGAGATRFGAPPASTAPAPAPAAVPAAAANSDGVTARVHTLRRQSAAGAAQEIVGLLLSGAFHVGDAAYFYLQPSASEPTLTAYRVVTAASGSGTAPPITTMNMPSSAVTNALGSGGGNVGVYEPLLAAEQEQEGWVGGGSGTTHHHHHHRNSKKALRSSNRKAHRSGSGSDSRHGGGYDDGAFFCLSGSSLCRTVAAAPAAAAATAEPEGFDITLDHLRPFQSLVPSSRQEVVAALAARDPNLKAEWVVALVEVEADTSISSSRGHRHHHRHRHHRAVRRTENVELLRVCWT